MGLGFSGACADGRPADQTGNILGHNAVQHFPVGRGNTHFRDLQAADVAGFFKAGADVAGAVEPWIVDQALFQPTGGARFSQSRCA